MKLLTRLSYSIIKASFDFSVRLIARFTETNAQHAAELKLTAMPPGSLGNEISKCLAANKVKLIRGFESHDLKHVVLDYKMTPLDEIRMQAFMLGNGNITFPCIAILLFGMVLLPSKWPAFISDFKRGRRAVAISGWTIDAYAHRNIAELRAGVFAPVVQRLKKEPLGIAKLVTYSVLFAGVAGMVFCLPYLFSSSIADLVGAGFPFVGGAILVAGGLNSLSNLSSAGQLSKSA